jgi:hypothetical protein
LADGRFLKDKTLCFYALNYAECRRNMTQGQWFVYNLLHLEEIPCIDTLKEKLNSNDTEFIEEMQYFSQCVPGSGSFWSSKRAELITWIGHHIEQRNGELYMLVTMSCIVYNWQDIEKLLNDRRNNAGRHPVSLTNIKDKAKAFNDYSIIIQEYVQSRVTEFLESYAKGVFGVHHYY